MHLSPHPPRSNSVWYVRAHNNFSLMVDVQRIFAAILAERSWQARLESKRVQRVLAAHCAYSGKKVFDVNEEQRCCI